MNQAAALAGELSRLDVEATRLSERRAAIEKERQACVRTLGIITGPAALTAVLPTVRVHRPYGGRGKLRRFLHDFLRDSAPASFHLISIALHPSLRHAHKRACLEPRLWVIESFMRRLH